MQISLFVQSGQKSFDAVGIFFLSLFRWWLRQWWASHTFRLGRVFQECLLAQVGCRRSRHGLGRSTGHSWRWGCTFHGLWDRNVSWIAFEKLMASEDVQLTASLKASSWSSWTCLHCLTASGSASSRSRASVSFYKKALQIHINKAKACQKCYLPSTDNNRTSSDTSPSSSPASSLFLLPVVSVWMSPLANLRANSSSFCSWVPRQR